MRDLALAGLLAWVLLGAFQFPLGLVSSPVQAADLLAVTGFASALTDIPLIALMQRRINDRHLAKALGVWEGGIAGAGAVVSLIAAGIIDHMGVRAGFVLSGTMLAVLGAVAAVVLRAIRKKRRRKSS